MTNRPNILLAVPRYLSAKDFGYVMPMGILYVSAALKASGKANVFTVNLNHENEADELVLSRIIHQNDISIVGTGGISGQYADIEALMSQVKSIAPNVITIVGGGMMTSDPIPAMTALHGVADYGVIGEGEITVAELCEALANDKPIESVDGLIYRLPSGEFHTTSHRADIDDIDKLPLPDYEGFNYQAYLDENPEVDNGKCYSRAAIIGGRSCIYNCTFCFHPTGSHYRQRSIDSILEEIKYLIDHYSVNYIALREELFAKDLDRVLEFCKRIVDYPVVWSIQLRVDSVCPEMVAALKASNCRYVFLGIESADNRILKSMRKRITIEQVEQALQSTISAGLDTRSTIIIGDAEETEESARRTLDWWKEHRKRSAIDLGLIIAFPGSALYKQARLNGRIPDPVQFLKDGCPVINLSTHLTDDMFQKIVDEVCAATCIPFKVYKYN